MSSDVNQDQLDHPYQISIISSHRPANMLRMHEHLQDAECTWYVGYSESQAYQEYNPNNQCYQIKESGKLIESRNQAIIDALNQQKDCIMIDDDLVKIKFKPLEKDQPSMDIQLQSAIRFMQYALYLQDEIHLAGIAPTSNEFFYPERIFDTDKFLISAFLYIRLPTIQNKDIPLSYPLFDSRMTLKEDYDYTLQHILKFGGALRCNQILANFKHYGNQGGVKDIRTAQEEQRNIAYLKQKWGTTIIKDNKRRPNEILLRIPKSNA